MAFGSERNVFHRRIAGGAATLDNHPALKLLAMRLQGMVEALKTQEQDRAINEQSFLERLSLLVDQPYPPLPTLSSLPAPFPPHCESVVATQLEKRGCG